MGDDHQSDCHHREGITFTPLSGTAIVTQSCRFVNARTGDHTPPLTCFFALLIRRRRGICGIFGIFGIFRGLVGEHFAIPELFSAANVAVTSRLLQVDLSVLITGESVEIVVVQISENVGDVLHDSVDFFSSIVR